MALVPCKECQTPISATAKLCPKCGAKAAARTSMFAWIVAAILAYEVIAHSFNTASSDKSVVPNAAVDPVITNQKPVPAAEKDEAMARYGPAPEFFSAEAKVLAHLQTEANDPDTIKLVGCAGVVADHKTGW